MVALEEPELRYILPIGFRLHEYQIESVLGKPGGFGITYRATDTYLQLSVAIKEYLPTDFAIREGVSSVHVKSVADKDNFLWGLKCFTEEAKVLARFTHPNIVRVLRFFEDNGTAYMVMEYQDGQSLAEYIIQHGTMPEADLLTIMLPLLDGLQTIHTAGFLHRDIKPTNIYIRHNKTPVLLDFGSARYAVGQRSRSVTSIVSPGYAPLEQYDNEIHEQGPWSDIYALGAVMYCAISGEAPPAATRRVMKDPIVPATQVGYGKYQKGLLTAIDWALELNKENRPQTIEEWRKSLSANGVVSAGHLPAQVGKPQRLPELFWSLTIATSIIVILLFTSAVGVLFYQSNEITKERILRTEVEKQLDMERKQLQATVTAKKSVEEALEKVRLLENQADIELQRFQEGNEEERESRVRYFDVTNVKSDDVLNLREFPNPRTPVLAPIPPNSKCITYLNRFYIVRNHIWVKVRYKETTGWVHSNYLIENKTCNESKKSH